MAGESSNPQNLERILQDIKAGRAEPRELPVQLLRNITGDFSAERVLGSGGFGVVYKGVLNNGGVVAVKKLNSGVMEREFQNEAHHLTRAKHENVVRFLGHCFDIQDKLLCLEYMPRGSLDKYIKDGSGELDWNVRYKIIKGICRGVHYLHEECRPNAPIIHMDLKPGNILLSDEMVPKINDFGLSRLFGEEKTRTITTRLFGEEKTRTITTNIVGTPGYMAPEFLGKGLITKKSDIYSLGLVIIQIISGRTFYPDLTGTQNSVHVLETWRRRMRESGRNSSLQKDCQQIKRCIEIGLSCVRNDPTKRPTSKDIIKSLDSTNGHVGNAPSGSAPPRTNPCEHTYQTSGSRTCAGCNNPIGHGKRTIAMGSDWHPQCFQCFACKSPISSQSRFYTKDNKPYDESCHSRLFDPKCCATCNNYIPKGTDGKFHFFKEGSEKYCLACGPPRRH